MNKLYVILDTKTNKIIRPFNAIAFVNKGTAKAQITGMTDKGYGGNERGLYTDIYRKYDKDRNNLRLRLSNSDAYLPIGENRHIYDEGIKKLKRERLNAIIKRGQELKTRLKILEIDINILIHNWRITNSGENK